MTTINQTRPARTLAQRVQRLKDVEAITKLMSRHNYYNTAFAFDELLSTLAQHTDGVTVELADWGVFEGLDGARKVLVDTLAGMVRTHDQGMQQVYPELERSDPKAGLLLESALTTPVLHVAEDGKTAKGLWMVMGAQSGFNPGAGKVDAAWAWVYFAVDFVKEGDQDTDWKIWHLRVAPRWRTSFDKSWAATAAEGPVKPPPGMVPPADRPPTSTPTDFAPNRPPRYEPRAPEPYDTFANTFSY